MLVLIKYKYNIQKQVAGSGVVELCVGLDANVELEINIKILQISMRGVRKQQKKIAESNSKRLKQRQSQEAQSNSSHESDIQSLSNSSDSQQYSSESSPVEAAIKNMVFRKKRGSKMRDLINGKIDNDPFWKKNCVYFGGNLQNRDQDQDEEDYEQSSSGRDEFDSDFNLTDSYPGKRGRKKGSRVKRTKGSGKGRGRPKRQLSSSDQESSLEESSEEKVKERQKSRSRSREKGRKKGVRKFKKVVGRQSDEFIILKAEPVRPLSKRGRRKEEEKGKEKWQNAESEEKGVI